MSDSDDASAEPEPEPEPVVEQGIGTCAEGFTRGEINETTAIVDDVLWGLRLFETAALAERSLSGSIAYGVPDAVVWGDPDPDPEGWRFEGDGTYGWSIDTMEVQTVFRFGADHTFATANEHPDRDLLDPGLYLVGTAFELGEWWPSEPGTLTFDGVGPYVELLGLGSEPQAPVLLEAERSARLGDPALMDLVLESDISVQYEFLGRTSIQFSATTPPSRTRELLTFEDPLEARAIDLVNAEILDLKDDDRQLQIDDWNLGLDSSGLWPSLRGEVAFHVDRGHFPIQGTITFEPDRGAEISIECG